MLWLESLEERITPSLAITTTTLANGTDNVAGYSQSIAASGGVTPLTFGLGSWATLNSLTTSREYVAVAAGTNGIIYAIGGDNAAGNSSEVDAFNPSTGNWSVVASLPDARTGLAATTGSNGIIYAIGGTGNTGISKEVDAFNPSTGKWTVLASLPDQRTALAAATGTNGIIYAIGGNGQFGFSSEVDAYNPTTGKWTVVASLPDARDLLSATGGKDGNIYAIGGSSVSGTSSEVDAFNPTTGKWTVVASLPDARTALAAATGANGAIYAIGGNTSSGLSNEVDAYSTTLGSWSVVGSLPDARDNSAAATGTNGLIYAVGGNTNSGYSGEADALTIASLPNGLSLNNSSGLISGTPTDTYGAFPISVTVTDSTGATASQSYTLTIMPPIATPLVVNYGSSATVNLSVLLLNPTGTVSYTSSLVDPLYTLQQQYGLTRPATYYDARGQNEWYLVNSSLTSLYVLMPNGNLYLYKKDPADNFLTDTLAGPVLATVDQAVYNNPLLLTSTTGVPLVSGVNPLYNLKLEFGLVTPAVTSMYNSRGADEEYLQSSNGSNAANGGWYLLLPNDTLVAWNGTPYAAGNLVANLGSYGNVYANPSLLTAATPPTSVGVTASITGSMLTLTPALGFDRSVMVTVKETAGATSASETFTFTVNDTGPSMPTVLAKTASHSATPSPFNLNVTYAESQALTYTATVTGDSALYLLQVKLGLNNPDISHTWLYQGTYLRVFQSSNDSNAANDGYYVLTPADQLYAAVLDPGLDLSATLTGANLAADFTMSAYSALGNVYNNPSLLYSAQLAPPVVPTNQGPLYDIREQYGLSTAAIGFNNRKADEWYFQSDNGSNSVGGGYYVLFPNGLLYAWATDPSDNLLTDTLAGTPVANLSSEGVWANPALLSDAQPVVTNDPVYAVREQFGLYTADLTHTWTYQGQYLRIFQSGNGSNSANGGYYVMTNNGNLYTFVENNFALTVAGTAVASLGANVYNNPDMLYSDIGQTLAVTAAVDSSGNVIITPNAGYVGTASVTASASDIAETASQTFSFTSTNAAPVIPTVTLPPVAHGSGASAFNLGASDADTNDTLTYTVQVVGYNPLYDLQVKLGLNNPDLSHTWLYQGEYLRIFQSSNGSNPANSGYYVLTPTDQLYAAVLDPGLDFSATLIPANLVADFSASPYPSTGNVYNDPALLYNAQAPAAPTVQTNRGPLYDVQQAYGLTAPDIAHSWTYQGSYLRVFQSSNGSNAVNGGLYLLAPNGPALCLGWQFDRHHASTDAGGQSERLWRLCQPGAAVQCPTGVRQLGAGPGRDGDCRFERQRDAHAKRGFCRDRAASSSPHPTAWR